MRPALFVSACASATGLVALAATIAIAQAPEADQSWYKSAFSGPPEDWHWVVVLGISSGLIVAAIVGIPRAYRKWSKSRPGNITGTYKATYVEDGTTYKDKISLEHFGRKVKGTMDTTAQAPGNVQYHYEFEGKFIEGTVAATFRSLPSSTYFEMDAFVVAQKRQGHEFDGIYTYEPREEGSSKQITSIDYVWSLDQ